MGFPITNIQIKEAEVAIILNEKNILPYYKIEKTNEGKDFFYSHIGYFNFWDEYLILHTKESEGKIFKVLVNRGNYKFKGVESTEEQKNSFKRAVVASVYFQKPEEMFKDFPELMSNFTESIVWTGLNAMKRNLKIALKRWGKSVWDYEED